MDILSVSAPGSISRCLDTALALPRAEPDVADFLFKGLDCTPIHPSYAIQPSVMRSRGTQTCLQMRWAMSYEPDPLYPPTAMHEDIPPRLAGPPSSFQRMLFMNEFMHFVCVSTLPCGVVVGYYMYSAERTNYRKLTGSPFESHHVGRFAVDVSDHRSPRILLTVCDGDRKYVGFTNHLLFPGGCRDFVSCILPAGQYSAAALPTDTVWCFSGLLYSQPTDASKPPFLASANKRGPATDPSSAIIDDILSGAAPRRPPRRGGGGGGGGGTLSKVPSSIKALDIIRNKLFSPFYSPGLRYDANPCTTSVTGRCDTGVHCATVKETDLMRSYMVETVQTASLFSHLGEANVFLGPLYAALSHKLSEERDTKNSASVVAPYSINHREPSGRGGLHGQISSEQKRKRRRMARERLNRKRMSVVKSHGMNLL